MSKARPADVHYYVDADVLGLAHVLCRLRPDVTYPGDPGGVVHRQERPACPITRPDVPDEKWIPEVASRGWLIITRDGNIRAHRREIAAVRGNNARMIALDTSAARSVFAQLEIVMCQ